MNIKLNKLLVAKVLIVAVPTYALAILTEQMVYTMPMLAITTLIATNLSDDKQDVENRIDEDGGDDGEDGGMFIDGWGQ